LFDAGYHHQLRLKSFAESLTAQDAPVVQVDWQPPAGGNGKLMAILERMQG